MNRFYYIFILIISFLSGCKDADERYHVGVIGHAAAGLDVDRVPYPGNTQESMDYARSLGVKHIELDIQLSADGHWILFHNDFMDFHTSVDGCISQFNADFLETVAYHGFPNIKIARLDKIDVGGFETVYLDLRHYQPCNNFAHIDTNLLYSGIEQFIESHPETHICLITNKLSLLPFFNSKGVDVYFEAQDFAQISQIHTLYIYAGFVVRNKNISAQEVTQIRSWGADLIIFDVKSYNGNKNAMRKNPTFVMTDAVASALILSQQP
jgi:hypothetical protein